MKKIFLISIISLIFSACNYKIIKKSELNHTLYNSIKRQQNFYNNIIFKWDKISEIEKTYLKNKLINRQHLYLQYYIKNNLYEIEKQFNDDDYICE